MKKILHVDDVQRFRTLVQMELETDYDVVSLDDCDRTLEMVAQHSPDLVILDHLMPSDNDDTGFDICQKLRQAHPTLPLVIFTGAWEDNSSPEEASEIWGARVVFKKEGEAELKKVVDSFLQAVET